MREALARLRGWIFRWMNLLTNRKVRVGPGLRIYRRLAIAGPGTVVIGRDCVVDGIRGDRSQYVTIDTHSPDAVIAIGDNARLHAGRISSRYAITIGDHVLIEEAGVTDTDFHSISRDRSLPPDELPERCRVLIGRNVRIGAKSMVTKGVAVGDNAVIGPGSVVTLPVRPGTTVLGNPAKPCVREAASSVGKEAQPSCSSAI
jgi:acetyltransferase-like isoleucine patch superfamily enzyme